MPDVIIRKVLSDPDRARYKELVVLPYTEAIRTELAPLKRLLSHEKSWTATILVSIMFSAFFAAIPYVIHPMLGAVVFSISVTGIIISSYFSAVQEAEEAIAKSQEEAEDEAFNKVWGSQ